MVSIVIGRRGQQIKKFTEYTNTRIVLATGGQGDYRSAEIKGKLLLGNAF